MSKVVLVEASPRIVSTGATTAVRLAGGGSKAFTQLGFNDWRAGVAENPKFTATIGFDQSGLTGSAIAQTGAIKFACGLISTITTLAAFHWIGARITVKIGDDEAASPSYGLVMTGTVAKATVAGGALVLTFGDLAVDLDKPVCPNTFAGTGGVEGGTDATGRIKRRTWGQVYNVEGRVLDKAYNIYEFSDPGQPLQGIPGLYDKGLAASSTTTVAWAGSQAATLTALRAANVPDGGGVICPSLACARWWTIPAGPLTADLYGEIGSAYVDTAPAIAARIVSIFAPSITVSNLAAALAWQSAKAGVHIDSNESASQVLDRLLFPVSTVWTLAGDGSFSFRELKWTGSVETIAAARIEREITFQPLKTRTLGYQRNHRQHSDSEISAALVSLPTNGENLVYNPDLAAGADNWFLSGNVGWTVGTAGTPTPGVFVHATGASIADPNRGIKFPTNNATKLFANINVFKDSGVTGSIDLVLYWWKADGTASATPQTTLSVVPPLASQWFKGLGGAFSVPTDAAKWSARINVSTGGSGNAYTGGLRIATTQPAADVTAAQTPSYKGIPSFAIDADSFGVITTMVPFDRQFTAFEGTIDVTASTNWALSGKNPSTLDIAVDNATTKGKVTIGTGIVSGTATLTATTPNGSVIPIPIIVTKTNAAAPISGGAGATSATITSLTSTGSATFVVGSSEVVVRSDSAGKLRFTFDITCAGTASGEITRNAGVKLSYATSAGGSRTDIVAEQQSGDYTPAIADGHISYGEIQLSMPSASTDYYFVAQVRKVSGGGIVSFPFVSIGIRQ